ncbi:hypothetical protein F4778DRAFT_151433 [Xylariomycetidae sp. FL2044]|nr:hypothetical protein F4778DRAFT_151433 [Xylariomycetidae sp. FL2044]
MSQREPARLSASPRTSASSPTDRSTSPSSIRPGLRGGGDPPQDARPPGGSDVPRTDGERNQTFPLRGLGMHNILNPADTQPQSNVAPSTAGRPSEAVVSHAQQASSTFNTSPPGQRPFTFRASTLGNQPQMFSSIGGPAHLVPPSTERDSVISRHPYSLMGARRILTPRSPQSTGGGYGQPPRSVNSQLPYYPPTSLAPNRTSQIDAQQPVKQEHSPREAGYQLLAPHLGRMNAPGGMASASNTPPRSVSQPFPGHPNAPGLDQHQGSTVPHTLPQLFPMETPFAASMPPHFAPPLATGDPRWPAPAQHGSLAVRNLPAPGAQPMFGIMPSHGEQIVVQIDTQQASRQADEKRQRNAGASARFRARKKDREVQQTFNVNRLENEARDMEMRLQDLEHQRDHYRNDRDRLREIVHRTPGISELAYQGPPSPTLTRRTSLTERSPLGSAPLPVRQPPVIPAPAYGSANPVTGERSSRRRRTDPLLEYSNPPSGSAQGLTQMPMTGYPMPLSQPTTPTASAQTATLPPLRLDQPSGASTPGPASGPSGPGTPAGGLPHLGREPHETGWATRPGGSRDPPGKH